MAASKQKKEYQDGDGMRNKERISGWKGDEK